MLRGLTDKQRRASEIAPKLQRRINEVHEKVSKLRARLEVNASVVGSLKKHKARLDEMKAELAEEEALKLLVEAYADKNMKRTAVKAISKRLMMGVNKYAKLIFPEDYEFDFIWDSSKLQLMVYRKYQQGKKMKVLPSDVRKLSGAESKLFTFILVLALLAFVPAHKRSNVLILDEPTANFGAETTESFKKLLPILNQVIPSIIVITPRTEERFEGAQEFTVLKEKGEARIVRGHPKSV
jgi:DNA repair exonuclease SbcCD ATPase subunit